MIYDLMPKVCADLNGQGMESCKRGASVADRKPVQQPWGGEKSRMSEELGESQ